MAKKEIDEEAIALRKEKNRARQAAYREANPEKVILKKLKQKKQIIAQLTVKK